MGYKFSDYDRENRQIVIETANGRNVSFSVQMMDQHSQEWLGEVLSRMFKEEIEHAVTTALNKHRAEMRKLLGIQ